VEVVPVNLVTGETKTPEYLKKHPFGQVPYLVGLEPKLHSAQIT